jgi:hypothetical protein
VVKLLDRLRIERHLAGVSRYRSGLSGGRGRDVRLDRRGR